MRDSIYKRKSVRNFQPKTLSATDVEYIQAYIKQQENLVGPFGSKIVIQFLQDSELNKIEKIASYGVIRNPQGYVLGKCENNPLAVFDFGYLFEGLILTLTTRGLGTCWLGGTLKRQEILQYFPVAENEIIPAISPVGYPQNNKHFRERVMRTVIRADHRKDRNELFFMGNFQHPLTELPDPYQYALNALHVAPSAKNNQPWRIIISEDFSSVHFYILKKLEKQKAFACAPEYIDIGIACRHFVEGIQVEGLQGELVVDDPKMEISSDMEYIATWVKG